MGIEEVVARTTTFFEPADDDGPPATLRDVLNTLGPLVLTHEAGPESSLDLPIGEPVVVGAGEPVPSITDELVLLTGGNDAPAQVIESVRLLAEAGCRAVVVKSWRHDMGELDRQADAAGLTLLRTPDETSWRQLDAMVAAARSAVVRIGPRNTGERNDLFALANSIAASLGGPVTIEETSGRVMAYSNLEGQEIDEIRRLAILGRQTPDRPTNVSEYQAVLRGPGPVKFESSDPAYADRMAVAVRAGHQVLGAIFVLCDRPRLVEDAARVLTDAARATALHLLRAPGGVDPGRVRRGQALHRLLAGTSPAEDVAAVLGIPASTTVVVATVRPAGGANGGDTVEAALARVLELVWLYGEYWHPAAAAVLDAGAIVLTLPVLTGGDESDDRLLIRLRKLGTDLVTAARRSGDVDLTVAVGAVVPLGEAARSRELADRVAEVLPVEDQVATLEDVRSAAVLAAVQDGLPTADEALTLPSVRALLHHDAAQGTEYARTLLVHFGCLGDMAATAQALNVHENTARYRVKRLGEMFGIDLSGGDETLVTWLQVRAACAARQGPGVR